MERRELLGALAAAAVAVPGCLEGGGTTDEPDDGPSDGAGLGVTPTDDGTTPATDHDADDGRTEAPSGETDAPGDDSTEGGTAGDDFVRESFVVPELVLPNSPDSFGVYGERGEQYVVAVVEASEAPAPAIEEIELAADGERYSATTDVGYSSYAMFDYGHSYRPPDDLQGWVVVPVPNPLDVADATLTWPGGEQSLGENAVVELARPPASFEVESFEATDSATDGDTVTATVTVENTGDVDGTFVAAVNRVGPQVAYAPETGVRLSVPAGETATWTYEHTVDLFDPISESRPMTVHLVTRDDGLSRDVTIEPEGTPTPTEESRTTTDPSETDDRGETATETPSGSGTGTPEPVERSVSPHW